MNFTQTNHNAGNVNNEQSARVQAQLTVLIRRIEEMEQGQHELAVDNHRLRRRIEQLEQKLGGVS